jgi:tetratricopeptide (TPR) repeat protein
VADGSPASADRHSPTLVTSVRLKQQSVALIDLGDALSAQGKLDEALELYEQSLAIAKRLTDQNKVDPRSLEHFAFSFRRVGDILAGQGKLDEALEAYQQDLTIPSS